MENQRIEELLESILERVGSLNQSIADLKLELMRARSTAPVPSKSMHPECKKCGRRHPTAAICRGNNPFLEELGETYIP